MSTIAPMPISYFTRRTALRLAKEGRWREASAAWRRLLAMNGARPSDYVRFARAAELNEGEEQAAEAFQTAAQRFPLDANVHRQHGLYLLRRRRGAEAALAFARGRILAPDDAVLRRDLAGLSIEARDERALAVRAYQDAPDPSPQAETRLGRLLSRSALRQARRAGKAGDWASAGRLYQKVLARRPGYAYGYLKLGHALKEAQDLKGAEAAYWRAVALTGSESEPFLHLGHALKLGGDEEASLAAYLAAWTIEPTHVAVNAELQDQGYASSGLAQLAKQILSTELSMGAIVPDGCDRGGGKALPYALEVRLKEQAVRADLARLLAVEAR